MEIQINEPYVQIYTDDAYFCKFTIKEMDAITEAYLKAKHPNTAEYIEDWLETLSES